MQYSGLNNSKARNLVVVFVPQYRCALCKSLQKQLFCNIHKLFPYVLYNIKYLLVISRSGSYQQDSPYSHLQQDLCILCTSPWQQTFPKFINSYFFCVFFLCVFFLLFGLYLKKQVSNLVIHPQKYIFAKFKADFSCNFTNI